MSLGRTSASMRGRSLSLPFKAVKAVVVEADGL